MVRYLAEEEKRKTRSMYEEIFDEDSKVFVDYYYKYKTRDNQIIVMEENDNLEVMIHLNPFRAYLHGEIVPVNYIVAVATKPSARKQGKMAALMKQALTDMYQAGQPFTFLMPVNPSIYKTAGFRFLPDTDILNYEAVLKNSGIGNGMDTYEPVDYNVRAAKKQDAGLLETFTNRTLKESHDLFLYRDSAYFERLLAEVKSENGKIILVGKDEKLIGAFSYGTEDGYAKIKEALFLPHMEDYLGKAVVSLFPPKEFSLEKVSMQNMRFMVRILDLRILGRMLKSKEPSVLRVQVTDDILVQNNGSYEIRTDLNGSSIRDILPREAEAMMTIGELSEVLFREMKVFLTEWV